MAFNVLAQVNDPIATAKDNEAVHVQLVQITKPNGSVTHRVEARVFVDNGADGGYVGPTKTALVFDDVDQITALVEALTDGVDHLNAQGVQLGTAAPVAAVPAAPAVPVVRKARQKRQAG